MPFFYFFLGFTILGTVCLQWANSAQPDVETNLDFSSIPGHLEELGAKNTKRSVEVIQSFPDPETFFRTYVDGSKPVLIQNGAKMSSAFEKWTDEYFLSLPKSSEHKIQAEQRKKEKRTVPPEEMSFSDFVKTYTEKDIYMVSSVPEFIRKDIVLPPPLLCRDITEADMIADAVMWFSSGGTKSVLHLDDGLDNINCLFRGTKELLFIDYQKYKHVVPIDFPAEGYSGVDVDRVDFEKYPGLIDVEYYNVTMQAGDCLFIPQRWFHQVRSYGRNIAVNLWWHHFPKFIPQYCDGMEPNQTLEKFNFTSLDELMESREHDMLNHLQSYLRKMNEISYRIFVRRLRKDPQLFNNDLTEWTEELKATARKLFRLMDVDRDKHFSVSDLQVLEEEDNRGKMKEIMNDFYRMADLIDKEREKNNEKTENGVSTEKENDDSLGDGDYYIEPVSRKTTGKTSKDEL